jgi:O-antigen/teichoic acid export membrane protein
VILLISSIVVARLLGKKHFGEYGMILYSVNLFTVFAGFGLGLTATKYVAEHRQNDKIKTGKVIGLTSFFAVIMGGVISLLIVIFASRIADDILNARHLTNSIRLAALIIFFNSINGALTGILSGFEDFKVISKVNILTCLIAVPLQILLTYIYGTNGCIIGFGFYYLLQCALTIYAVYLVTSKAQINIIFNGLLSELGIIYKFSLPTLISGLLVTLVMWLATTFLVNQKNGYEELGVFNAANQWRNAILFIPTVLAQITLPLLASTNDDKGEFKKILKINIFINFVLSILIALVISLFSKLIMSTYGQDFKEGYLVLVILTFSSVLISVNNVIGQAIFARGKIWFGFILNLIWGLILLSTSYAFSINGYGAFGLSISFLIAYLLHTILVAFFTFFILLKKD